MEQRAPSRRRPESRIPRFRNREEEAEWWDTHDVTDYLDELEPVDIEFAEKLSEKVTVHLDMATFRALEARAREQGMPVSTLIHIWLMERLQADQDDG